MTRMHPRITTAHERVTDRPTLIRYRYRITNLPGTRYRIVSLGLASALPAKTISLPDEWKAFDQGERGPSWRATTAGIEPGKEIDGPAFESSVLPGVVLMRIGSRTTAESEGHRVVSDQAGSLDVPHEKGGAIFSVATIGPAINVGSWRQGVTPETSWLRVATHYAAEFARYDHPYALPLDHLPGMLAADAEDRQYSALAVGLALRDISLLPVPDAWCSELSAGLRMCAEVLLSWASSPDVP